VNVNTKSEEIPLSVGLIKDQSPLSATLEEMLSHIGVQYDLIDGKDDEKKYPAVILSSGNRIEAARRHVLDEDNIIMAHDVCDLKLVYSHLSGSINHDKDPNEPIVNIEEQKLYNRIRFSFAKNGLPFVTKSLWPGNKNFCFVMTHDVDWLSYRPIHRAVYRGGIGIRRSLSLITLGLLSNKNYGWNIPEILELERRYGIKSTFFFRTLYDSFAHLFPESVKLVKQAGCEIGLHASFNSHTSTSSMKLQLEHLHKISGQSIKGIRHHILKIRVPDTWKIEAEEGLSYDATFSYNRLFGFRAGCCYPYHPIELDRLPIIELPTSFMDWTALHRKMRGGVFSKRLKMALDIVSQYNGVMVVNFHNTYINRYTFDDVYSTYEDILKKASAGNAWIATASECVDWWRFREEAKLNPMFVENDTVKVDILEPPAEIHAGKNYKLRAMTYGPKSY
jgi:peptidoglycan/xylan/chitin deacetylase (PgdA/CDA1 family)